MRQLDYKIFETTTCYTLHANCDFRNPRASPPKLAIILPLDEEARSRKRVQLLQGNLRTMAGSASVWTAGTSQGRREMDGIQNKNLNFMNTLKPDRGNCYFPLVSCSLTIVSWQKMCVELTSRICWCVFGSRSTPIAKSVLSLSLSLLWSGFNSGIRLFIVNYSNRWPPYGYHHLFWGVFAFGKCLSGS